MIQTPKIDFNLLSEDWDVFDSDINDHCTVAIKEDKEIRVYYADPVGVNKIRVKKGDDVIYEQCFNFLLKPSVMELKKILNAAGIEDWEKYYTAC